MKLAVLQAVGRGTIGLRSRGMEAKQTLRHCSSWRPCSDGYGHSRIGCVHARWYRNWVESNRLLRIQSLSLSNYTLQGHLGHCVQTPSRLPRTALQVALSIAQTSKQYIRLAFEGCYGRSRGWSRIHFANDKLASNFSGPSINGRKSGFKAVKISTSGLGRLAKQSEIYKTRRFWVTCLWHTPCSEVSL